MTFGRIVVLGGEKGRDCMTKYDVDTQVTAWIGEGKSNEEVQRLVATWKDAAARKRARRILEARSVPPRQ